MSMNNLELFTWTLYAAGYVIWAAAGLTYFAKLRRRRARQHQLTH